MKKNITKLFVFFIVLLSFTFALCACGDDAVTGITISSKDNIKQIQVGDTLELTAVVYPENANQSVLWSTSDESKATISDAGLVTAKAVGNVSIKATSVENVSISQSFPLVIVEKEEPIILPESIKITSPDDKKEIKIGEKLTLTAVVYPLDANQTIDWSSSDEAIATVKRGEVTGVAEGKATITAFSKGTPTVKSTIEIKVLKTDTVPVNKEFEKLPFITHADFIEAEKDTMVKVKGIVSYALPVEDGKVSYYIQNGVDGYYVYQQDIVSFPVEVGKIYEVGGYKKYHQGNNEIVNVEYIKEIKETITYQPNDIMGKDKDVSSVSAMNPYHNSYVSGTAIVTKVPSISEKAFNINVKINDKATVLRVAPTNMSEEEFTAICNQLKTVMINTSIEFKGIMTAFGYGKPSTQILILKSSEIQVSEPSAEDLIQAAKASLTIKTSLQETVDKIDLPSSLSTYPNVDISWESDSALIDAATGAVSHTDQDTLVTLTATIKHKTQLTVLDEKVFKVNVFALKFTQEKVLTFDLEDAAEANNYGVSASKPSYSTEDDMVTLGSPTAKWLLKNTLIAKDAHTEGFGLRAQNNTDPEKAARIEIQQAGEYNYVEFSAAIYGNDDPIHLAIEYIMDGQSEWVDSGVIINIDSTSLDDYRVTLPKGVKRIAIRIVGSEGKRVNIDNIALYK